MNATLTRYFIIFTIGLFTIGLLGSIGCGGSGDGQAGSSGGSGPMLAKLESIHPTPEQLGSGWTYATGRRRGVVGGKLINQVYANKTLGASSVRLEANRYESIDKAKKMYEMNISGIDTPPYSGIGQEARIENRKSRTKYVLLVFRRANIVIQVKGQGHDHGPVLRVAEVVDGMIKKNLE